MATNLILAIQVLVGLGFFSAMVALWKQRLRWRMDLFVMCVEKTDPVMRSFSYTCALHNAEDRDLIAPFACEIAIDEAGVGFDPDIHIFVDPINRPSRCRVERREDTRVTLRRERPKSAPRKEVLVIEATGMRAKETWFVRFGSPTSPNNVVMRIKSREGSGRGLLSLPLVQRQELRPAGIGSFSTGSGTKRAKTWKIVGALGALVYWGAVTLRTNGWRELSGRDYMQMFGDFFIAAALIAAAYLVMKMSWRSNIPFIQGYLDEVAQFEWQYVSLRKEAVVGPAMAVGYQPR